MVILLNLIYGEKENAEKHQKIYSSRKGSDSPRGFGHQRTRKTNSRALPKISPHQKHSFGAGLVQHRASLWCWV